jgi:hypothetical protein
MFDKPIIQTSNPNKRVGSDEVNSRTIFYGEVISIDDPIDGGRIKVKLPDLDNKKNLDDLPWCYPIIPKFIHQYPKVGEVVRILIEDIKYPEKGRFWTGSVISQAHKMEYDALISALSTTNMGLLPPDKAISKYPDAKGVFPNKEDIAIIGRFNTDVVLKNNQVVIRAGKHESNDIFKLNKINPAIIDIVFEPNKDSNKYESKQVLLADKIALISHDGNPKFKSNSLTTEDRDKIFNEGHPMARADVLVEALNIIRKALLGHVHGYSNLAADKNSIISDLEKIDFNAIIQKNIVIN